MKAMRVAAFGAPPVLAQLAEPQLRPGLPLAPASRELTEVA